jgi:hypothetical protein
VAIRSVERHQDREKKSFVVFTPSIYVDRGTEVFENILHFAELSSRPIEVVNYIRIESFALARISFRQFVNEAPNQHRRFVVILFKAADSVEKSCILFLKTLGNDLTQTRWGNFAQSFERFARIGFALHLPPKQNLNGVTLWMQPIHLRVVRDAEQYKIANVTSFVI